MAIIIATQHADGSITVDDYPPETQIAAELLCAANPRFLSVDGNAVTLRAANGWATYALTDYDPFRRVWTAERMARGV